MNDETKRINEMLAEMKEKREETSDEQRENARVFSEQMSRWTAASGALKQFQQGRDIVREFYEVNQRVRSIAEQFYDYGIIKNRETVDRAMSAVIYNPTLNFQTQFKLFDTGVSLAKIFEDLNKTRHALSSITSAPYISLYDNILDVVDGEGFDEIERVLKSKRNKSDTGKVTKESSDQQVVINNYYIDTGAKINLSVQITDSVIAEEVNIQPEQKASWGKTKLVLGVLGQMFLAWGMGDTSLDQNMLSQTLQDVAGVVEAYQYPVETTEVKIDGLETMDLKTNEVEETDLEIKE